MPFLGERNDMPEPTCTVPECEKPLRSAKAKWCKMHYHRWYRHGDVNRVASGSEVSASHGRRYRIVTRQGHPLAGAAGRVYEHRLVLHDTIGPGSHPCHWCGVVLSWSSTRGDADCLMVDHLNAIGDDNRPENLVPACVGCNNTRGAQARAEALRKAGFWSQHDTIAGLKSGARRPAVRPHAV